MASANNGVIVDRKRIIVSALYKLKSMDAFNKWVTFAEDLPLGPEGCSKGVITQLPDDLLSLIYRKLNKLCDQRSFIRTCHLFLDIAILSCKCLKVDDNDVTTKLRKSYNPLDSIVLGRYLHRFSHYPSSISVLNLDFSPITDKGLEALTKYCNKTTLMNVSLRRCRHITNTGILFVKKNCPQLRVLKISSCKNVSGVTSEQGFWATLTYLEADSLALCPTGFLSGGGLEYLNVFNLNENGCSNLAYIGSGIAKNLKILSFRKGSYVTDECIMEISKGCPLLQVLNVSSCYREGIGLPGWVSIGLHCQNLEKLHVNNSKDLCDTGLLALGNCSKLSVLYMSDCPKVTPDGKNKFKIQRPDVKIETTMEVLFFPECTTY
ncbi:F-box/LRR-repeat protein 12-like isoform X1 [Rutidosis leptorrhynchoides]|uniref:F-box/LRR-repeat protein 12-like isoform X1 n=1 Tax=Rutidosis leptorrhynchoides TaxID=125765 RepID=UPI003A99CA6B